jgi:hypothetical protein
MGSKPKANPDISPLTKNKANDRQKTSASTATNDKHAIGEQHLALLDQ